MNESLTQKLEKHFGFDRFLPGQAEVIEHLLAGKSAAAVFPTGGGKSLCYQLPALLLDGLTIIVSPLIALMKDQLDALNRRGIAAAKLDSTLTLEEYRQVMRQVRHGSLRMLYLAPERFQNERFRQALDRMRIALFAVDEAHCISEWGHNFRPDYLKLVEFARRMGAERCLALTATATPKVLDDICRAFDINPSCVVRNSFYRSNLTILTTPSSTEDRDPLLLERLRSRPVGPTIVYVTLQKTAEMIADKLAANGFHARAYHAGMEDTDRAAVQEWFMRSTSGIVVATIAFGMGIDKSDIRYVYHYNMPKSLENYSQEIGRAGRDGQAAICEMLVCRDDLSLLENFAYGDTPSRAAIERLLNLLFSQGTQFDVGYYELSARSDIRLLVVRTLLTYLELDGYLVGGTPFYSTYKFRPLQTSKQILSNFQGERRDFLERLFRLAQQGKTWFQIDVKCAAETLGQPRERIVRALDYLAERAWMELRATDTRHRYEVRRMPENLVALADELYQRSATRERQEIQRLHQVLELAGSEDCQVNFLCRHFGEMPDTPCGHCTRCLNESPPMALRADQRESVDDTLVEQAMALRKEHPEIKDAVAWARLLCGITSPALTRAKLTKHPLFGACAGQRFEELRERFETTQF